MVEGCPGGFIQKDQNSTNLVTLYIIYWYWFICMICYDGKEQNDPSYVQSIENKMILKLTYYSAKGYLIVASSYSVGASNIQMAVCTEFSTISPMLNYGL